MNEPRNVDRRATAGMSMPAPTSPGPSFLPMGSINFGPHGPRAEKPLLPKTIFPLAGDIRADGPPRREVDAIQALRDELAHERAARAELEARVKALEEANDLSRREP